MSKLALSSAEIRVAVLETTASMSSNQPTRSFDFPMVLNIAAKRFAEARDPIDERRFLDQWHDLVRTVIIAPRNSFASNAHPWYHLTERGQRTVANLSRCPANPSGYLEFLRAHAEINQTAQSYAAEALDSAAALMKLANEDAWLAGRSAKQSAT